MKNKLLVQDNALTSARYEMTTKHERMLERLRSYGLVGEQINRIVTKYTPTAINKSLYDLDCNKEGIKNTAAYLLKVFE